VKCVWCDQPAVCMVRLTSKWGDLLSEFAGCEVVRDEEVALAPSLSMVEVDILPVGASS
jgi:hypothetical protein